MNIKLIKKTNSNGEIFYRIDKNDHYVYSTTCYGGNFYKSTPEELKDKYQEALEMYKHYIENCNLIEVEETILETEI